MKTTLRRYAKGQASAAPTPAGPETEPCSVPTFREAVRDGLKALGLAFLIFVGGCLVAGIADRVSTAVTGISYSEVSN